MTPLSYGHRSADSTGSRGPPLSYGIRQKARTPNKILVPLRICGRLERGKIARRRAIRCLLYFDGKESPPSPI